MSPNKEYRYEIWRGGVFLGLLSPVTSPFNYDWSINTALTQLLITVGKSPDIAKLPPTAILDETGNPVLDETGEIIYEDGQQEIVGEGTLIDNDNDVLVYEISSFWPNGKLVYKGYISKYKPNFGGTKDIGITCLTNGQDFANHLIPGQNADFVDQQQNTGGDDVGFWATRGYGQTFTTSPGVTNLSQIELPLSTGNNGVRTFTLQLWDNGAAANGGGSPLATVIVNLYSPGVFVDTMFVMPTPIPVTGSTQYLMTLLLDSGSVSGDFETWGGWDGSGSNPYSGGETWRRTSGTWIPDPTLAPSTRDQKFKTYYNTNTTTRTYSDQDPGSDILDDVMDVYISESGLLSKQAGGYPVTGVITDATFKLNTTLEGIQKIVALGPANYYWLADIATEELVYTAAASTADHILVKGVHLKDIDIEISKEDIANIAYFSGGDDGGGLGTSVFTKVISTTSLVDNRIGLTRLSDNRVTGVDGVSQGQLLAQNYLDRHDSETYTAVVTVVHPTYDISLFKPGQMIGFSGFGTFPDNLLLQIISVNYNENYATLTLGTATRRTSNQVQDLEKQLTDLQTVANPNVPS